MNSLEDIEVSIILPTLNEGENLETLVPEIISNIPSSIINYEILIIDDNSSDNTHQIVDQLNSQNKRINIFERNAEASLPMSIYDGISLSKYEYVMWLDADGSMPPETVGKLLEKSATDPETVFIGSRFSNGGGYKGVEKENQNLVQVVKNVYSSEDSVLAVFLSKIFNTFLYKLINAGVKDVTSGFIVGKKKYFSKKIFSNASYGDYFIYLIKDLKKNNIKMKELGYICLTRQFGVSKSGTSPMQLLKRAFPYFKASLFDIK